MKTNSYKANWKIKQIVSGVLAAIVLATGGTLIAKNVNKNKVKDNGTTTSISDQSLPEKNNPEYPDLLLTADFDINDEKAVRERAEAIYALNNRYTVEDLMNIIYFVNGANKKIDLSILKNNPSKYFPDDKNLDLSKLKQNAIEYLYIQRLSSKLYNLLQSYLPGFQNVIMTINSGEKIDEEVIENLKEEYKKFVQAHMFVAQSGEIKNTLLKLSDFETKQAKAAIDGDKDTLDKNAQDYYDYVKAIKYEEFKAREVVTLGNQIQANNIIMAKNLTKEQYDELSVYIQNTLDAFKEAATEALGTLGLADANKDVVLDDVVQNTTIKATEKYVASDKAVAQKVAGNSKDAGKKVEVEAGGKKVSSGTTKVQGGKVIKTETRTFVADVPTTSYTKTSKGGQVITEYYNDDDAKAAQEAEKKAETTTIVVDEGGAHVYVDADGSYSLTKK